MPGDIHTEMIQAKGAAYRASQINPKSHYLEPVDHQDGRLAGNSRVWGDATPEVQSRAIDALVGASREARLNARDTAHVLAIARIESGFNPDAAAGTTTASGLGQFIDDTGSAYDLTDANRFDVDAQASALVAHFIDNRALAQRRGQDEGYIYKYHHDGPSRDYGGLALARDKVLPLLDDYTRFVEQRFGIERSDEASTRAASAAAGIGSGGAPEGAELLREGARGNGVADLQVLLTGLGYTDARDRPLQGDGMFGPRTGEAVRAFQQAQGLPPDGIVGPETRGALDRAQKLKSDAPRGSDSLASPPLENLLAAARSGDSATLQAALDDFAATRFGQMFRQVQALPVQEGERSGQIDVPPQCGPER